MKLFMKYNHILNIELQKVNACGFAMTFAEYLNKRLALRLIKEAREQ